MSREATKQPDVSSITTQTRVTPHVLVILGDLERKQDDFMGAHGKRATSAPNRLRPGREPQVLTSVVGERPGVFGAVRPSSKRSSPRTTSMRC